MPWICLKFIQFELKCRYAWQIALKTGFFLHFALLTCFWTSKCCVCQANTFRDHKLLYFWFEINICHASVQPTALRAAYFFIFLRPAAGSLISPPPCGRDFLLNHRPAAGYLLIFPRPAGGILLNYHRAPPGRVL